MRTRREKIIIKVFFALLFVAIVSEIYDPQVAVHYFGEPAVHNAPNAFCNSLVAFRPFWTDKPLYATKITPDGDFFYHYYLGQQQIQARSVEMCIDLRERRLSRFKV